jgi:hypothetical protein
VLGLARSDAGAAALAATGAEVHCGVIGRRLNVPVVAKSRKAAADHFGWFALFAEMDVPTSSEQSRALLNWQPKDPGRIADLDQRGYFEM